MTTLPAAIISTIEQCDITEHHSFTAQFAGMRKPQVFSIYSAKARETSIVIQSKTRIGEVFLDTGVCRLSPNFSGGAFFMHLAMANDNSVIQEDDLIKIKDAISKALA